MYIKKCKNIAIDKSPLLASFYSNIIKYPISDIHDFVDRFSNEIICRTFLEQIRWNGTPTCPFCNCQKQYTLKDGKTYKCANNKCYKKYTVTVKTIFENTNIPLQSWLTAIYLCMFYKNRVSSTELSRLLSITQKSAYIIIDKIIKLTHGFLINPNKGY